MTTRDRLMLMGLAVLAVLAAGWFLGVAPERNDAAQLSKQVESARQQLQTAQAQLADARNAQVQYATAYASIVRLGKAVPADQQVPSLVYELDQASNQKDVNFASIATGSNGSSGASAAAASPAATAASTGAFTQMPFTFVFKGSFFRLYRLLNELQGFTVRKGADDIQVGGRLLTIQGATLSAQSEGNGHGSSGELTGTITATAYVLPAGQGLTGGATPSSPAGTPAAQPASAAGASSPTTAAVARVTP